jgi:hypothetical protein
MCSNGAMNASDELRIPSLANIEAKIQALLEELSTLKRLRRVARALLRAEQARKQKEASQMGRR